MPEHDTPIPTPWPQRATDFRRRHLPLLVWLVAALVCGWMLIGHHGHFEYLGLAQARSYEVSASSTGRLDRLLVDLYDVVEAGDVLVRLDDTELFARVERSQATIRQLTAGLNATKVQLLATNDQDRADWTTNLRRFQADEEQRRLTMLELRAAIEAGEIEEERLRLELERSDPSAAAGLLPDWERESMRLIHEEVAKRNQENRGLLDQTEHEYLAAQGRRREFEAGLPTFPTEEPLLRPLREGIEVETRRLQEIQARRLALVLRSPISGKVSQILCRDGQTVVPGEPILTVSEPAVREIVAYLAESDGRRITRNQTVVVASAGRPETVAESFVLRTGPGLEMMPERLWQDPGVPTYGRAVIIAAVPALDLTPGELISVRFPDAP